MLTDVLSPYLLKAEFDMLSEDFSECLNDLGMPGTSLHRFLDLKLFFKKDPDQCNYHIH